MRGFLLSTLLVRERLERVSIPRLALPMIMTATGIGFRQDVIYPPIEEPKRILAPGATRSAPVRPVLPIAKKIPVPSSANSATIPALLET